MKMNNHAAFRVYLFFTLWASCTTQVRAEDWPTRLHDIRRGGITQRTTHVAAGRRMESQNPSALPGMDRVARI